MASYSTNLLSYVTLLLFLCVTTTRDTYPNSHTTMAEHKQSDERLEQAKRNASAAYALFALRVQPLDEILGKLREVGTESTCRQAVNAIDFARDTIIECSLLARQMWQTKTAAADAHKTLIESIRLTDEMALSLSRTSERHSEIASDKERAEKHLRHSEFLKYSTSRLFWEYAGRCVLRNMTLLTDEATELIEDNKPDMIAKALVLEANGKHHEDQCAQHNFPAEYKAAKEACSTLYEQTASLAREWVPVRLRHMEKKCSKSDRVHDITECVDTNAHKAVSELANMELESQAADAVKQLKRKADVRVDMLHASEEENAAAASHRGAKRVKPTE